MSAPEQPSRFRTPSDAARMVPWRQVREIMPRIVDRLTRVMEPDYIPVWLSRPIEALGDQKPLELIARGRVRTVARVVSELESPGAV